MYILGYPLQALVYIIDTLIFLYTIIIIASVVISWLKPDPRHPVVGLLHRLTTPLYAKVRPYLPNTSQLDLAPLVVLLGFMFIQKGILPVIARFAQNLILAG